MYSVNCCKVMTLVNAIRDVETMLQYNTKMSLIMADDSWKYLDKRHFISKYLPETNKIIWNVEKFEKSLKNFNISHTCSDRFKSGEHGRAMDYLKVIWLSLKALLCHLCSHWSYCCITFLKSSPLGNMACIMGTMYISVIHVKSDSSFLSLWSQKPLHG